MDQQSVEDGEQKQRNEGKECLVGVIVSERVDRRATEPSVNASQLRRVRRRISLRLNAALEELGQRSTGGRHAHHHNDHASSLRCTQNLHRRRR